MISQRSDIFTDGMREVLDSDDQSFRHKILNWYVDVFKERETHQSFKKKVSEKLELLIKQIESNHQSVGKFQDRLTKFLETAASIERFEQMVKAFDFDDWDKCAVVRNLFQQTIELLMIM